MPELPEVETTLRGIQPFLERHTIREIKVRDRRLRWPITPGLEAEVEGQQVIKLRRRGKYILIYLQYGGLLIHLGMSGSIRVLAKPTPPDRHDHFDIITTENNIIRYRDPRRFGCFLYTDDLDNHERLTNLGVEPLTDEFNGDLLYRISKRKNIPVKSLIMDGNTVVGVGNIYACESLYKSGIDPFRKCHRISRQRYHRLADEIKTTLANAINQGGTTLQDFTGADGKPGYFEQQLMVYGREGKKCPGCQGKIKRKPLAQRSTFYCASCQR